MNRSILRIVTEDPSGKIVVTLFRLDVEKITKTRTDDIVKINQKVLLQLRNFMIFTHRLLTIQFTHNIANTTGM